MEHTRDRLSKALQDAGVSHFIWCRSVLGYYDDFQSSLPFPKIALIDDLERAGNIEFADRVRAGEFDSTETEAQLWLREKRERLIEWRKMRDAEKRKS